MSRENIPDWKDMPDSISLASLAWEDIFIVAHDELGRTPTKQETVDMFDEISKSMINATQDDLPDQLQTLIPEIVAECLKSKPYDPHSMNNEQLVSKKYCHECQEIHETYWELNHCEKNPERIDVFTEEHGNDDTCEDGYCNPGSTQVGKEDINKSYINNHAVYERCVECHQYFDSAGPQK